MVPRRLFRVVGRPNHVESCLCTDETFAQPQALGFFGVVRLGNKRLQIANMAIPEPDIGPLPGFEAFSIPIAGEHAFAGEERSDVRMIETFALENCPPA